MDFEENEDESDNFSTLLMTLQNYFSIKIPAKRLTPNSELLSFFNIQSILNKDHKSLLNLSKLLLCISSFCSNKIANLKKISSLDLSLVQVYYDSVYLFLIKNIEKKTSISKNNILTSSIFEEERVLEKKEMEIEKLKRIIEEKDSLLNQYKTSELLKHDISIIQTDQDFLAAGDEMTMMNFDFDFDIKNNAKNYKIEKNTSFCFEKINIKQIFMDSLPTSQKNTNNSNNSSQNYSISKYFFNLWGGDFLHRKIDSLGETISKNKTMNEKVINDYENKIKNLEERLENIKLEYNEKISQMIQNHRNEIEKLINEKTINFSDEIIRFKNEKNIEIENLRNLLNDKEGLKNKEIEEIKKQLNLEKANREKEAKLFNYDRIKMKNEYDKNINDLNNRIKDYDNKLKIAYNKLNSDPYYAREIMSKALYSFASKIMIEK